jgi:hypothetical protein
MRRQIRGFKVPPPRLIDPAYGDPHENSVSAAQLDLSYRHYGGNYHGSDPQRWVGHSRPKDYTTTDVLVHTAADSKVTTVAHYRTTNTTHRADANGSGNATIPYYISGATPG